MRKYTLLFIVAIISVFSNSFGQAGAINTIAGSASTSATAEGIPATSFHFTTAAGIWTDPAGNIYIADEHAKKVKKIDAVTGLIYTVAGTGISGFSGDGGPATNAQIGNVRSIRVDAYNNLYLGDYSNNRIRKVDAGTGVITTVAGGGSSTLDGVAATTSSLSFLGFTLDAANNIYVYSNNRIKVVNATTGVITTIAGGGLSAAEGIPATTASVSQPRYMLTDPAGNLYFLDNGGSKLRKVDIATGNITTIVGGGSITPDSCVATAFALNDCHSFSIDPSGNIIILDRINAGKIRRVFYGAMTLMAGGGSSFADGVPATTANLTNYHWIHIDAAGNMYITNWSYGTAYARKINSFAPVTCTGTPAAGTIVPSITTACATTPVSLTLYGYTSTTGISFQWQSSPDSATWSNIAGAMSNVCSITGLTSTTYYRCKSACAMSGLSSYSPGIKITSTAVCPCAGVPTAGSATASTASCSACSFTLDLTGATSTSGILYQWEQSFNGTSGWTNISGATTIPYSYTPAGAYHYRCKVTCSTSGLSGYSSSVFVGYAYSIVADSAGTVTDSTCTSARLFTRVNGLSPFLRVKTLYGDGLKDSLSLTPSGVTSFSSVLHSYNTPGSYSIKRILYYNNIPQDSIVRTFVHIPCKIIPVKLYLDYDGNSVKGSSEPFNTIPVKIRVDSNSITIRTITATSGLFYVAKGPVGTVYTFSVLPGSRYVSAPVSGVLTTTISATVSSYPVQYFGLGCSTVSLSDLAVSAVVPVTGRRDQWGHIYLRNNFCNPTNATVTLKYSFKYSASASWHLAPSSTLFPTLTWNISGVSAISPQTDMYFVGWAPMSALLTAGDTVVEEITVTSTSGPDCDTTNNHIIRVDTVKASCDPNLIEVSPAGCFDTNTHFQFTVHFENTGNDTAHNVYVLDTLSDYLDASSLQVVMSSAEIMNIYPYSAGGHSIVKFDFPGIKLLDSSWHGLNDGAFIYNINTKPGMSLGQSIFSRVGIYFDYNDVVMTNNVENRKGCPVVDVQQIGSSRIINIYPNPATDELTIRTEPGVFTSLIISNTMGQQMMLHPIVNATNQVNVKLLPPGMYYVTLKGAAGSEVRKFVQW